MGKQQILTIRCPRCNLDASAKVGPFKKFLVYTCPKCGSNVVLYDNKVDIISDKLLGKLIKSGRVRSCGDVRFRGVSKVEKSYGKSELTAEAVTDLKILLNTTDDFDSIVSQL